METAMTESVNFGIIHLSDIHFSTEKNFIKPKFNSFFNSLKDDFQNCDHIFIVVSGDIADKGRSAEYEVAFDFFVSLSDNLKKRYVSTNIGFIFTPGNHDCNFLAEPKLRQNAILNINYDTLGSDNSVINNCIQIQSDFWNFFSLYCEVPQNKLFYRITEEINHKKICFHCFNTSWMSQKEEKPGSLFFPIKKIPELEKTNDSDINIAVFHHPINWLTPNSVQNNRKEFQNAVDMISSLQIIGHEHENELRTSENLDIPSSKTFYANGEILQDLTNAEISGFQTFAIDVSNSNFRVSRYRWKKDIYQKYDEKEYALQRKFTRSVNLQESFIFSLNKINLPLPFGHRKVTLPDLYVYPHLEHISMKASDKMDDYIDSIRLTEFTTEGTYILEGESQVGKSSLLSRLLLASYEKGLYPILLDGSKIHNDNFEKSIKEAFNSQYAYSADFAT